jgi:hypothetical protein
MFDFVVVVADVLQVTLAADAEKAIAIVQGDWKTKVLSQQTIFYSASKEEESYESGNNIQQVSLDLLKIAYKY